MCTIINDYILTTILKHKTYTSFTNVASGWANKLPSERPTALEKKKKEYNLVVVGLMERALIQPEKRIKLEEFSIESRK